MLHTVFTQEHNHICDLLKHQNPKWDDEQLYRKAKLITSALMAKIHTVDWTPAILPHPILVTALRTTGRGWPATISRTRCSSSTRKSSSAASSD